MNINVYCKNCNEGLAHKGEESEVIVKEEVSYNYATELKEVLCICPECSEPNFIQEVVGAKSNKKTSLTEEFLKSRNNEETSLLEDCLNDRYGITNDGDIIAYW